MRVSKTAAILVASLALGCTRTEPPAPVPTSVTPDRGPAGERVPVVIAGEGFVPHVVVDFRDQGQSRIDETFQVSLGNVALRDVALQEDGTLTATVPDTLAAGWHDLAVTDPAGRTGTLADAYRVLETGTPVALAFAVPSLEVTAGRCSGAVTVETRDAVGALAAVADELRVNLSAAPATGFEFFADDACATAVTAVTIAAASASAQLRVRGRTAGTVQVSAAALGLASAALPVTVTPNPPASLAITSAPQTLALWACSAPLTLEARDDEGNPSSVVVPTPVTLAAEPAAGFGFFADPACTAPIAATTIPAGDDTARVYFRGTSPGDVTVAVSSEGLAGAVQVQAIQAAAGGALAFVTARQSARSSACSGPVRLQAQDAAGAPAPVAQATSVSLAAIPPEGFAFFADAACTTEVTAVTLAARESEATFHFRGTAPGDVTVTASAPGFTPAIQTETVLSSGASVLVFASAPQSVPQGSCSAPVELETRDDAGNAAAVTSALPVAIGSQPAGLALFADATCTTPAASLTVDAGSSRATFHFQGAAAGSFALRAAATGFTAASQPATVLPPGAGSLEIVSAAQSVPAGDCSEPVTVETQDSSGSPAPVGADTAVSLVAAPAQGFAFYADAGCATEAGTATIAAGSARATFWVRGTVAGRATITASAAGLATATQDETVAPGPAAILVFDAIPSPQLDGTPFPVTVRAEDAFGNTTPFFTGGATLSLLPTGTLACPAGCSAATLTTPLVNGSWTGQLSVSPEGAGRQLVASGNGLSGTSNAFDVLQSVEAAPIARFTLAPAAVAVGQAVNVDASTSTDYETPAADLEVSWDFTGTAPGLPPWSPWTRTKTATTTYAAAGTYTIRLAVRDATGAVGYGAGTALVVADATDICVVTDATDVDDGASSCTGALGPDGALSLPEAIRVTDATPGRQVVTFSGPMQLVAPTGVRGTLAPVGELDVVAPSGVVLGYAFRVTIGAFLFANLEITARSTQKPQRDAVVTLQDVFLHDGAGVDAAGEVVFDRVRAVNCGGAAGACLSVVALTATVQVRHSEFLDMPGAAIALPSCAADALHVQSSVFARAPVAIDISPTGGACAGAIEVTHSTFHANGTAIRYNEAGGHVLRNSIFSSQSVEAVGCGRNTAFTSRDLHLLSQNVSDGCLAGDPSTLTGDPLYVLESADDYRLLGASPARDSALDLGLDVNGVAPGNFLGAGPDRGGRESL